MSTGIGGALRACRGAFLAVAAFSALINVLMLTAPLYMLQVFDRVLTSRSMDTLLALSVIATFAVLILAIMEGVRSIALVRIGQWVDTRLGAAVLRANIKAVGFTSGALARDGLTDLATLRGFVSGPSILPLFDAPWTPLFVVVIFLLDPILGWMAVCGATALMGLALLNEYLTREPAQTSARHQVDAGQQARSSLQNAAAIEAMGMLGDMVKRWQRANARAVKQQGTASVVNSVFGATSKFVRLGLQLAMLGAGAWLVIGNELTPGGMIAATILLGRALAPVDSAIGSWRAFVAARAAYARIDADLDRRSDDAIAMPIPRPQGILSCEQVTFKHHPEAEPAVRNVSFELPAGCALGLIGPSAAGKSTLGRLLVGVCAPRLGHVRLDGMDLTKWHSEDRGQYIGYLPQDVALFDGTVAENIARMGEVDGQRVTEAAQLAGVHGLIMRMPQGYETEVGPHGSALSGGQRQRVALARAIYGNPSLVLLDEPSANLDTEGIDSLLSCVDALKRRKTTVVLIAHQPSIVRQMDYLVAMGEGAVRLSGPRDEVLAKVTGKGAGVSSVA